MPKIFFIGRLWHLTFCRRTPLPFKHSIRRHLMHMQSNETHPKPKLKRRMLMFFGFVFLCRKPSRQATKSLSPTPPPVKERQIPHGRSALDPTPNEQCRPQRATYLKPLSSVTSQKSLSLFIFLAPTRKMPLMRPPRRPVDGDLPLRRSLGSRGLPAPGLVPPRRRHGRRRWQDDARKRAG